MENPKWPFPNTDPQRSMVLKETRPEGRIPSGPARERVCPVPGFLPFLIPFILAVLCFSITNGNEGVLPAFADSRSALPSLEGNAGWIGPTGPVSSPGLAGKVVLFDFWDYTCINCIRTFPHLNHLYEKYKKEGLVVVGIHSPEFSFAADPSRIEDAIRRYMIVFPVVMDRDQKLWNRFRNHYWPADYLYDPQGHLVYHSIGEGGYGQLEENVRKALNLGKTGEKFPDSSGEYGDFQRLTPELYTGVNRGTLGNREGYSPGKFSFYHGTVHTEGRIVLLGSWEAEPDHITSGKPWKHRPSMVSVLYRGTGVNAVLKTPVNGSSRGKIPVVVRLDGTPVPNAFKGGDLHVRSDGETFLSVHRARMYTLVANHPFGLHRLELLFPRKGTEIYTLTFNP